MDLQFVKPKRIVMFPSIEMQYISRKGASPQLLGHQNLFL